MSREFGELRNGLMILELIGGRTCLEVNAIRKMSLTPPRRLSSYDDGEENAAHPHMMICRLRRNACIEERCQ